MDMASSNAKLVTEYCSVMMNVANVGEGHTTHCWFSRSARGGTNGALIRKCAPLTAIP